MKTVFKILSISLLLSAGLVSAYANPGQHQEWRDEARAMQLQQVLEQRDSAQMQRIERKRAREAGSSSGGGQSSQGNNVSNPAPDESRKAGRMTPEERRALRRQINEAGRDIYAPAR